MDDNWNERPTYIGIESPFFFTQLLEATSGTGQCGSDVQFYARNPAALFDELVHALVQLYEPDFCPPVATRCLPFDSVLNQSESWWRLFASLQPSCPLNIDVLVRFQNAWWEIMWPGSDVKPNAKHRAVRRELAKEVDLLGRWLAAKRKLEVPTPKNQAEEPNRPKVTTPFHSEHFDSVNWFGEAYTFTAKQAAAIRLLWEAWEAGRPSVLGIDLIEAAGSNGTRVRDIFKSGRYVHPAWNSMIIKAGKSHYQLSAPESSESQQRPT